MKRALSLAAAVLAFVGCAKKEFREVPSGAHRFADAEVSIDVGPGWLRIDAVPEGMCSPTLASKTGLIQAYWAHPEFPTIDAVIAQAKKSHAAEPAEEREFRSEAGVQGKLYSVAQHPTKSGEIENRITKLVLRTRSGRLLIFDLIGPDGSLHKEAQEAMIRTLAHDPKSKQSPTRR